MNSVLIFLLVSLMSALSTTAYAQPEPFFKRKIAELEIDLTALEFTELRSLAGEASGKGPGPESSLLKIKGSEIQQRITE